MNSICFHDKHVKGWSREGRLQKAEVGSDLFFLQLLNKAEASPHTSAIMCDYGLHSRDATKQQQKGRVGSRDPNGFTHSYQDRSSRGVGRTQMNDAGSRRITEAGIHTCKVQELLFSLSSIHVSQMKTLAGTWGGLDASGEGTVQI